MSSTPPNPITDPAARTKIPTFDELSKLFSRPLTDAADSLGVCPSVLKKVCYDNGLVRWPYRKVLAGKSIEEIKKDVALEKEKQKQLSQLKVVGGSNVALANSAMSSSLSQQNAVGSRFITQQPGKEHLSVLSSTTNKDSSATSDEFKYGFPSDGLSRVSYRWWGSKSGTQDGGDSIKSVDENADENKENSDEQKQQSEDTANVPSKDGELTEGKTQGTDGYSQHTSSLSALRKKAAKEGRQALKLGVYRGYGMQTLDQAKKLALLQIFKSSLPSEWDLTSQS